jgi:uncharacterized membrane protein (UPF0127 family)
MRISVATLTLLFASLLLVAGCGGGSSETSSENGSASTAGTGPATTAETTQAGAPEATVRIINSAGEEVDVGVEIANTREEREKGLMDRTSLPEDRGMLFVFDREQPLSFWMKNTLIPLSIAYIDSQGRIVDIQDMQPLDETPHPSAEPAQYALEVNQGFFADRGIEVGNVLQ